MTAAGSASPAGNPSQRAERSKFPAPREGFVVTFFLAVSDKRRSTEFYTNVLGGELIRDTGENAGSIIRLANTWLILHGPDGPTEDRPGIDITVPTDPDRVSAYLTIRVANIWQAYHEWSSKGAQFLTAPKDRGVELRCYISHPDGHLIEVGEATGALAELSD